MFPLGRARGSFWWCLLEWATEVVPPLPDFAETGRGEDVEPTLELLLGVVLAEVVDGFLFEDNCVEPPEEGLDNLGAVHCKEGLHCG